MGTTNELAGRQRHGLAAIVTFDTVIVLFECDALLVGRDQPAVRTTMRVGGDIRQTASGPAKGRLAWTCHLGVIERLDPALECGMVDELGMIGEELEMACSPTFYGPRRCGVRPEEMCELVSEDIQHATNRPFEFGSICRQRTWCVELVDHGSIPDRSVRRVQRRPAMDSCERRAGKARMPVSVPDCARLSGTPPSWLLCKWKLKSYQTYFPQFDCAI